MSDNMEFGYGVGVGVATNMTMHNLIAVDLLCTFRVDAVWTFFVQTDKIAKPKINNR